MLDVDAHFRANRKFAGVDGRRQFKGVGGGIVVAAQAVGSVVGVVARHRVVAVVVCEVQRIAAVQQHRFAQGVRRLCSNRGVEQVAGGFGELVVGDGVAVGEIGVLRVAQIFFVGVAIVELSCDFVAVFAVKVFILNCRICVYGVGERVRQGVAAIHIFVGVDNRCRLFAALAASGFVVGYFGLSKQHVVWREVEVEREVERHRKIVVVSFAFVHRYARRLIVVEIFSHRSLTLALVVVVEVGNSRKFVFLLPSLKGRLPAVLIAESAHLLAKVGAHIPRDAVETVRHKH